MQWLSLVLAVVKLLNAFIEWQRIQDAKNEARAQLLREIEDEANRMVAAARAARASVPDDPADVLRDPDNRDNDQPQSRDQESRL